MKRIVTLLFAIALLVAALVTAQRQHARAAAGGQSLLYLIADSERELTRLPSHFTRIPDKDEVAYGNTLANVYLVSRPKPSPDEVRAQEYVEAVGRRIAPHAERRLKFEFHYMPDRSFLNAFALPGGHVFVGAGLLDKMTTEDELASVLAHEIEHVDHFHCAERLQVEAALRKIPLGAAFQIPVAVFQAGYDKDQELEADREGVLLAARSGYSALGAIRSFEMLDKLSREKPKAASTPQQEAAHVAADVLTGYFRSHPPTSDRLAQVRGMIDRQPALAATPERKLGIQYIFLAWQALDAVHAEKFAEGADLAARALADHPDHPIAMQALCEADFGLDRHAAAQDVYRKLLEGDPQIADAVELWTESRAQALANAKEYDRELALVESMLVVQPSQPRLLRLAVWAYALKSDDAAAAKKAELFRRLYGDAASQASNDADRAAAELLGAGNFSQAVSMANLALALDPTRAAPMQTLGNAEFAQAHFAEAADAYEKMFDEGNLDVAWLRSLTDALAAAHPRTAAAELQAFLAGHQLKSIDEASMSIENAGLALMAGSDAKAIEVLRQVQASSIAPESLARLGWWYLRAGRTAAGRDVLRKALALRPGDAEIQNALAWTELEEAALSATSPTAGGPSSESILENGTDVRDALIAWQAGRKADALKSWSAVAQSKPQWTNPAWRAALYPPRTNAIAQQLETERQRQAEMHKVARRVGR